MVLSMLDFNQLYEMLRVEPGHGLAQTILLAMIWWTSSGLKKELISLGEKIADLRTHHEFRLEKLEDRLTVIETKIGGIHDINHQLT